MVDVKVVRGVATEDLRDPARRFDREALGIGKAFEVQLVKREFVNMN
jgi:hypothetical protein